MRRSSLFPRSSFLILLRPSRGTYVDGVVCPCPLPIPEARQGKARRGNSASFGNHGFFSSFSWTLRSYVIGPVRGWIRGVFPPEASSVGNYS